MTRSGLAAIAVVIAAGGAHAQDAPPPETRWYGWQIMLADVAGGALIYAGAKTDNAAVGWTGAALMLAVSPLLHLAHHAPGDAGLAFLVRAAPLGLSLAIFAALHPDCGEGCSELVIPAAGLVLSGVGVLADWAFLSTEQIEPRVSLAPMVPLDRRRGVGLGLALRF